ncbi:globin CTT-VIII-like [Palaemon carinicauda]|uniref:globin CTT-VIII-like n=1 Tax=Palaemon carinicauda TaxID=392227 RepID=UPI0035B5D245
MGASAAKPEGANGATGDSCPAVNNNTSKEKSLKILNRRSSKSSNPSQSPARQKKSENKEKVSEQEAKKENDETAPPNKEGNQEEGPKEESFPEPPAMSEEQKVLIKDSWKALEANIAKVGIVIFIKLFETHPDVQEVFMPFRGVALEDIKQSKQLRAHALRVMGFVNKAVGRLDQPEKLLPLLSDCGKSHYYYGANISYIDLVGPQFIASIRPSLEEEERWNTEMEAAWELLFQHIAFQMKTAIQNEASQ